MKKIVLIFFAAVALVIVAGLLLRNSIAVRFTEQSLSRITAMYVKIKYLDIKLTFDRLIAKDVTILNPPGEYKDQRAITINELDADFEPFSFLTQNFHFKKLAIDIPTVVVVRNAKGEVNLTRLRSEKENSSSASKKFKIDEFVLTLGQIIYIDERRTSAEPLVYEINIKNRLYKNLNSPDDAKKIVMNLIVENVPRNLLGFGKQILERGVGDAGEILDKGTDGAGNLIKKGVEGIGGIFGGDDHEEKSQPPD